MMIVRNPVVSYALFILAAAHTTSVNADVLVHGPIVQWLDDPCTKATITWVERFMPPIGEPGTWNIGRGGFGYDADGITTVLHTMQGGYDAVSIRTQIDVSALPEQGELLIDLLYDDAVIVWANGHEIIRRGVRGVGASAANVVAHEATEVETYSVKNWHALIGPDEHLTVAIQGFNVDIDSSDFAVVARVRWRDGSNEETLIAGNAFWEFYYGGFPTDGWQLRTAGRQPDETSLAERPAADSPPARYRPFGTERWHEMNVASRPFADTPSIQRKAELNGLEPDTVYEFAIPIANNAQRESAILRFRTAPETQPEILTFVTGGDMYHRRRWLDAMNAQAGAQDPMFALLGGDLAYANGRTAQRWYDWLDSWHEHARTSGDLLLPMIVVIGNHETGSGLSEAYAAEHDVHPHAKFHYSLFVPSRTRTNFVVDFGDYMSVIGLDSDHSQPAGAQTDWLRRALRARNSRTVYVCYHRPTYGALVKPDSPTVRRHWVPLFEAFNVAAVFENDHHVYVRTHPIRDANVDSTGVPYIGDGAWGVETRDIPNVSHLPYIAQTASVRHLIRVDVQYDSRVYTAVDAEGNVIDTWIDDRSRDRE